MTEKRNNLGVSEIIGTILLLGISVTLFSTLQFYVFSADHTIDSPDALIGGRLEDEVIVLKHLGGPSLEEARIHYQIGDSSIEILLNSSYFIDDNQNQKWDVGESIRYPVSFDGNSFIEAKVVDENSNELLFINVLQNGERTESDSSPNNTPNSDWWNEDWQLRIRLNITAGENIPHNNYKGYTVQFTHDTDSTDFLSSCDDLRIVYQENDEFHELDREVLDEHTSTSFIRFKLQENISANSFDNKYYMYYSNPSADQAPHDKSEIYLWYDSAEIDREDEYIQGKVDGSSHGNGWADSIEWDTLGYYTFDTGDNAVDSLRPSDLTERDIYIEYEIYQTNAFPYDMTTGPLLRWSGSGSEASEDSSHFFYYEMADSLFQVSGYSSHDDITSDNRNDVVLAYGNLFIFPPFTWTRIGFAACDSEPTQLKTFYDDESGGWADYRFSGAVDDNQNAGQFGVWIQQDQGRIKNILARRYIEPEPIVNIEDVEEI